MFKEKYPDVEIIIVFENFFEKRDGAMNSVIRKINAMNDAWGYQPIVFLTNYNIEIGKILHDLEMAAHDPGQIYLNQNARIINLYDILQNKTRCYEAGKQFQYAEVATSEGKKDKTIVYDENGRVSKVIIHDPDNSEHIMCEYYYTTDDKPCLKVDYKHNEKEGIFDFLHYKHEITGIVLFNDDGAVAQSFGDNIELAAFCLNAITDDDSKKYIVIDETGKYTKSIAMLKKPNIIRSILLHGVFLQDSYTFLQNVNNNAYNPFYKHLCNNHEAFDGIVFLTRRQREDFIHLFGDRGNTYVIPHFYTSTVQKADFEKRDHKKAVIVARLDRVKQLHVAVEVFAYVVRQVPDAKLEIYGTGPDEKTTQQAIDEYQLNNNVTLMGYTSDPASVLETAALSLNTSYAEGFPLSIMESICNGCPVFAFDIKYGPSDLIRNGETGYLIPRDNVQAMAMRIIYYLQDIELQRRMSQNAYDDSTRFNRSDYLDKWLTFVDDMVK
jgi:poly(glycerol-phosphate) alpha-glucosyltransferase